MKLVTAACALAAGIALADGVTSANTVGYDNSITTAQGFNFLAVPFNSVGYNTADIQGIKISDGGLGGIGWGGENFSMWEGAPDVVADTEFVYWDDYNGGYYWSDENGGQAFSIAPGQGFVIYCVEGLTMQFAGEVSDADITATTAQGFNFFGNSFAAPIDIQDISISDGGLGTIGWGGENFSLWEGAPDVVADTEFVYWDDYNGGYYWSDENGGQTFTINPGQGFVIYCVADLDVTIESPYTL